MKKEAQQVMKAILLYPQNKEYGCIYLEFFWTKNYFLKKKLIFVYLNNIFKIIRI